MSARSPSQIGWRKGINLNWTLLTKAWSEPGYYILYFSKCLVFLFFFFLIKFRLICKQFCLLCRETFLAHLSASLVVLVWVGPWWNRLHIRNQGPKLAPGLITSVAYTSTLPRWQHNGTAMLPGRVAGDFKPVRHLGQKPWANKIYAMVNA